MADKSDWRLVGQERYLKGITLIHQKYRRDSKNPTWDHDHCEFCWAKFMVENFPDVLDVGYATTDLYRWICEKCFQDFKEMFGWSVEELLD